MSPQNATQAQVDQFTAARIAAVLGRDPRSIRDALNGREADGHCVVSGNAAKTYLASSLPERIRLALEELASARGYDSSERMLSRNEQRWQHPVAISDLHPEELNRAKKRAIALAEFAGAYSVGARKAADIASDGATAHERIVGHRLSSGAIETILRRVISRDGGRGEFERWELYLPENARRVSSDGGEEQVEAFQHVEGYIDTVDAAAPTLSDRSWVWTAMCDNLQQLLQAGENLRVARRGLVNYVFSRAPWMSSSKQSLSKCFDDKWGRFCAGEKFIGDRRPEQSGRFRDLPLTDEDEKKLIAESLCGGIAKAWRELLRSGSLSPAVCQYSISNPSCKSYVPSRVRELVGPQVQMLEDIHHGPRQAKLNGAHITRDWSSVLPGDWYQSDDCTSPVYYWEHGPDGKPHAIRGQLLPMIDCKTTRILAFALHSEKNYNATVIRGLILRTHDSFGLPRNGLYFERGIWKSAKLLKGKGDEVSGEETERGLRDHVKFMHAELPRGKVIEGVLGILQRHMESIPGYVGRNEQTERFERIQKKLQLARAGHIDFASFLLHKDQWAAKLQDLFDLYNGERQDGRLKGLSPREAWDTQFDFDRPLVRLHGPARRLLANHRRPLKVTKNGICVEFGRDRYWFRNEETGRLIGQIVQVYFNPEDMSSIWIQRSLDDSNAIVVPLAPTIPAMSATSADISAAKANCNAHNRPALTLYREVAKHLPQNSPSLFRQNIVSQDFIDDSRAIAEQQAAIKAGQITDQDQKKKVARFERSLGKIPGSDGVSDERRLAAYELLKASQNEHS